jgi:hypothetical protein
MTRLGRVRARLLLTLKSLTAHLATKYIRSSINHGNSLNINKQENDAHLAFQIKRRGVRVCAFSPQLRREHAQCRKHALTLGAARGYNARAEFLRRVRFRSKHCGIVVDSGIDEQRAALACTAGGAKIVDAAGLDVDARDLDSIVCCEYRELDRAAP